MSVGVAHPNLARLSGEGGVTIVEVLVAALILTIGFLGVVGAFNSGRKLSLLSERRTEMSHRAQLELERLQAKPYSELEMSSAPSHSSETSNPDYYVKSGTTPEYQYGTSSSETEKLVVATTSTSGMISPSPSGRECSSYIGACEWKDGQFSGKVYDFISWHTDGNCGSSCPSSSNYKRLTVAVTLTVPSGSTAVAPIRVSTFIAEPSS
jgi:Tfp pilus assembly protein PilV